LSWSTPATRYHAEGCAAILWKDAGQAPAAAEALKLTAEDLKRLHLIDTSSLNRCGAHRDPARRSRWSAMPCRRAGPLLGLDIAALKPGGVTNSSEMARGA